ncbi:tagatose-bisphosphate aldolase subunit GatZ [Zophobihabitans entericus]|uniref:D-tagatose-1,6-bisphosphate aldolase subunit GatZ n=1 Tax=Zophobihabitans entericus TaxID=1635327 RepID=A0A6G9IB30_9GAMM|nr:tagatose-bisphosphate aldolase subunit GatZ [Zophobihabitans entericus]QIQ21032.1 tagatose-bisphosphate aldolase subunit GatZ [Zophobihabitans entericus]
MKAIIAAHKNHQHIGIYSVCSAHPLVIEATLHFNLNLDCKVLIESTSNQVNQFGGYTGMTPADFRDFVYAIADKVGFPKQRIILGGDHLGPNCWQNEPSEQAMLKSEVLIAEYVKAGFTKIHLDTSMSCADDTIPLDPEIVAKRSARLCLSAEQAATTEQKAQLSYVIGTEVPVPGGESHAIDTVQVTTTTSAEQTITTHKVAFEKLGLTEAFTRVIAIVVQPGVEFDHSNIVHYEADKAKTLSQFIEATNLVYEAHSTDYQTPNHLRELVRDHFAILKVGPALTFALREAVFALAHIEKVLITPENQSHIIDVMNDVMLNDPKYWQKYYSTQYSQYRIDLDFSLSDRCRYYWPEPRICQALDKLLLNLSMVKIPLGVLSQYMPIQFNRVLEQHCPLEAKALLLDKIQDILRQYDYACR